MHKVLVCQHVPHEILGTFHPLLKKNGFRIRYANFGRHPDLRTNVQDYDGLIILGGPMNVDEVDRYPFLAHEIELIQEAIRQDIPVLGICLGAQLIAKTLGAKVQAKTCIEVGWKAIETTAEGKKDPLFSAFHDQESIFEWHYDSFPLPPRTTLLAGSAACPVQAFRYGDKVYGFQFHLEVDQAMVEKWLADPQHLEFLQSACNQNLTLEIQNDCQQKMQTLHQLSEKTFTQFIALFGSCQKRRRLPSR